MGTTDLGYLCALRCERLVSIHWTCHSSKDYCHAITSTSRTTMVLLQSSNPLRLQEHTVHSWNLHCRYWSILITSHAGKHPQQLTSKHTTRPKPDGKFKNKSQIQLQEASVINLKPESRCLQKYNLAGYQDKWIYF